jgi:hypothetical protein
MTSSHSRVYEIHGHAVLLDIFINLGLVVRVKAQRIEDLS